MKTKITFLSIALFLIFSLQAENKNILSNSGFEESNNIRTSITNYNGDFLNQWALVLKSSSTGSAVITSETGNVYNGNNALKVNLTNISARYHFYLVQELENVQPAKDTLSVWLKADKADIPFRLDVFYLSEYTASTGTAVEFKKQEFKTTTGWKKYEMIVDFTGIDKNALKLVQTFIRFNCYSGGSVDNTNVPINYWIDDIELRGDIPETIPVFTPVPYLQTKTSSGILVNWFSAVGEEGTPTVEYGLSASALNQSAQGTVKAVSTKRWSEVKLTGLSADTEYYYRCRINDNVSPVYTFRTLPDNNATSRKIRFISFGDTHEASTTTTVSAAALTKIKSLYGDDFHNYIDFIVHTGDIVTSYGEVIDEFENVHFTPRKDFTSYVPVLISAGNHDFEKNDSQHSFFYDFMNFEDLSDATGNAKGKYFSQQIMNSLFIYLNTNNQYLCDETSTNTSYQAQTAAQLNWLENKLNTAASDPAIQHIFVFGHHMPFTEIAPAYNIDKVTTRIFPLLKNSEKVRLYQCGHTHAFERAIVEKNDGLGSFVMNMNGNSGSYPDYFGRYSPVTDFQQTHRSLEYTGFTVTEIDPANGSYETKYYAYGQRRLVDGESSTRFIRTYKPVEEKDRWGYKTNQAGPEKPTLDVSLSSNTLSISGSTYTDNTYNLMSVQIQLFEQGTSTALKDTTVHWENIFNTTGYNADINFAYLPVNLNASKDITKASFTVDGAKKYEVRIRYRNQNFTWSEWSDKVTGTSTGLIDITAGGISVYPTKTNGTIQVSGIQSAASYTLFGSTGNIVGQGSIAPEASINLENCREGIYLLLINDASNGINARYKIIKTNK